MKSLHYNQIRFLKSVVAIHDLPPDQGYEVAFVGRSNSGKSSALNTITGVNRLARSSKIPGRTQMINFFEFDSLHRFADLPGYGYAKVPDKLKIHWRELIEGYLDQRQSLKGIILLMDIRHPLTPLDWQLIEWGTVRDLPFHVLLTKADKLKRAAAQKVFLEVQQALSGYEDFISLQLFSTFKPIGVLEARDKIEQWFELNKPIL